MQYPPCSGPSANSASTAAVTSKRTAKVIFAETQVARSQSSQGNAVKNATSRDPDDRGKSASRDTPERPKTVAIIECRRRDSNPRHADHDSVFEVGRRWGRSRYVVLDIGFPTSRRLDQPYAISRHQKDLLSLTIPGGRCLLQEDDPDREREPQKIYCPTVRRRKARAMVEFDPVKNSTP